MSGSSGEHLARVLLFELETHGAADALSSHVRAIEQLGPGQGRILLAADSSGAVPEADGVILADGSDGIWAVDRARALHMAGFHGLVVAFSHVPAREVVIAGFSAGIHVWESPPIDAEVFAASLHSLVRRILGDDAELEVPVLLNRPARELLLDHQRIKLSPRGFDCFVYLVERRGRWVKAQEILNSVFRSHHASDSAVVRVLILRMRESLGNLAWILESKDGYGYRVTLRRDSTPARLHLPHARFGAGHKRSRST